LHELKVLQKREGKSLGQLDSDLLAHALKQQGQQRAEVRSFVWNSSPIGARVDLSDTEALYSVMDEDQETTSAIAEEVR
jgi:hypothetical protein